MILFLFRGLDLLSLVSSCGLLNGFLVYKSLCACAFRSSFILVRGCLKQMPRERRRSTAPRPARRKKGTATTLSEQASSDTA